MVSDSNAFKCQFFPIRLMVEFLKNALAFLSVNCSVFRGRGGYFLFVLALLGLISCANMNSSRSIDLTASKAVKSLTRETNSEYTLQTGDVIDIKFFYNPKLNELVTIRPDGKISLQLVDEVLAVGLTPAELDRILTEKYTKVIRQPEVAVIVKEFVGQQVYVGGEVKVPGVIPISGKLTALQAIFQAGGFRETAHPASVVIISMNMEMKPVARKINIKKIISGKAPEKDNFLRPFDIVYVPKTFIAKADRFVDQYIRKMIPGTLSAGFSYFVGKQRTSDRSIREGTQF